MCNVLQTADHIQSTTTFPSPRRSSLSPTAFFILSTNPDPTRRSPRPNSPIQHPINHTSTPIPPRHRHIRHIHPVTSHALITALVQRKDAIDIRDRSNTGSVGVQSPAVAGGEVSGLDGFAAAGRVEGGCDALVEGYGGRVDGADGRGGAVACCGLGEGVW